MQHRQVSRWRALPGVLLISIVTLISILAYHQVLRYQEPDRPPIDRPFPKYPIQAAMNKTEGFVRLAFDISTDGYTSNVRVIESQPEDVFDAMALAAIKTWRYEAASETTFVHRVQLDFSLPPADEEKGL